MTSQGKCATHFSTEFGTQPSTGNFSVSFGAAMKMVGADLMWLEPPSNNVAAVEPERQVH